MTDINVTRRDDETIPDARVAAGPPVERTVQPGPPVVDYAEPVAPAPLVHSEPEVPIEYGPPAAGGVVLDTDDPNVARREIEETRERMSETIDQIEGALLRKKDDVLRMKDDVIRKKEDIEDRLDVLSPMRRKARENPYPIIGGVFLGGLILGLLTGGDDDDDEEDGPQPAVRKFAADFDAERAHGYHWEERANTWERRARRLMDLANRQEAELLEMRGESVPVKRRRGLFGRGRSRTEELSFDDSSFGEGGYATSGYVDTDTELEVGVQAPRYAPPYREEYDGMPLNEADSYPPQDDDRDGGYGRDPLPAPI